MAAKNLPSIPAIPGNISSDLFSVLSAIKMHLDYAQENPSSETTNAVDQAQLESAVADAVTGIAKGISGAPGAPGKDGVNGKSYVLDITGGRTSIIYDADGANPLPTMTAFEAQLYEDGVLVTPDSYSWFISDPGNSLLSGTGSSDTFTPTVASTFNRNKADNSVVLVVGYAGLSILATEPIAITKVGATGATGATGPQGNAGTPGAPGTNSYFHVAYADSANGITNFNQVSGSYIGTYVDSNPTDSSSPSAYRWVPIKGAQGPKGDQGLPGTQGAEGTTSYLHIKYSDDGGATFTANGGEDVGKYIGTYVNTTLADSTNVSDYKWALIKGADGSNGKTYLLFITGGKTNAIYDTGGANPLPTPTAFGCELYENGTLVTPSSYIWSVPASNSLMSGSSETATFTPTLQSTFDANKGDNRVLLTVTYAGQTVKAVQPIAITRQTADTEPDMTTPNAIDHLEVTGGVLHNFLTWGTVPANTDHVDVYRAASVKIFSPGPLTLNGNATITDNTITKVVGDNLWDVQAYSSENYTDRCVIRFQFPKQSFMAAGLNTGPDLTEIVYDDAYTYLDYAFYGAGNGNLYTYDADGFTFVDTYTATDVLEIEYINASIIYKKNDLVVRIATTTPQKTFYFDSALYLSEELNTGIASTVSNIEFGQYVMTVPSRDDAIVIGTSKIRMYADYLPQGVGSIYYYWLRAISKTGVTGEWNLVNGEVSSSGTTASPIGIGDSQVHSLSAEKIVTSSLSAISANLGTVTAGVIQSADETFTIDLSSKSITVTGAGGVAASDYTLMQNGQLQFWKWTGSGHQQGQSLNTIESGQANNGALVTLSKWYPSIPKILISPSNAPVYNKDYASQSQRLQVMAEDVAITNGGQVSFKAIARLMLSNANPSINVGENFSSSTNTWTTTPIVTAANTTSISVNFDASSQRGTGTSPRFYYRKVVVRLGWRVNGSGGAYTYSSPVTINMSNNFDVYTASLSSGTITAGTWQFVVEFTASDKDGTYFNSGATQYAYGTDVVVNIGGQATVTAGTSPLTNTTTVSYTFSTFTPPAGFTAAHVYQVNYAFNYDFHLKTREPTNLDPSTFNSNIQKGTTVLRKLYSNGGTDTASGTTNNESHPVTSDAYGKVWGDDPLNTTAGSTYAYKTSSHTASHSFTLYGEYPRNQARFKLVSATATIKTRKSANTTTPANMFELVSYALTLQSAQIIDTSGTVNWMAIG